MVTLRPCELIFTLRMTSLGIDVGGTSVKAAALSDGTITWTARSDPYHRPSFQQLAAAIAQAAARAGGAVDRIGLCVPGIPDASRQRIVYAANMPALHEVSLHELIQASIGASAPAPIVVNDANATGFDIYSTRKPTGRLLVIAIGAGVGASVIDDGKPLFVEGDSAGHVGQMDISIEGVPVVGPDGGAGGLEGYIGASALRTYYGSNPAGKIRPGDPAFAAIVKLIRVCHAFYRPQHIVLAGGLGIRLGHLLSDLRKGIENRLTVLARKDWTIACGDSDFHAASGAARVAASETWPD